MTKGMRATGKCIKVAHDYDRKLFKREGRRAVRLALKAMDRKCVNKEYNIEGMQRILSSHRLAIS